MTDRSTAASPTSSVSVPRDGEKTQTPVRHGDHPLEAIELNCVIRGARRRPERCGPDAYRVRHLAMSP